MSFQRILFSIIAILAISVSAVADVSEGWQALVENRYADAIAAFDEASSESPEQSLQGHMMTAWAKGDYLDAALALSQLTVDYADSPMLPVYLSLFSQPAIKGWTPADRLETLEKALASGPDASHTQRLQYERMQTLDLLAGDDLEQAARQAGVLSEHWQAVGVFGRYGVSDFMAPFGPELEWKNQYEGWNGPAKFREITRPGASGSLSLGGLFYPNEGIVYLANVIEADEAEDVELSVYSSANLRIWLNGEPVAQTFHLAFHTANVLSAEISLQPGKNLIVIKTQPIDQWSVRALLRSTGDDDVSVRSVPFSMDDWRDQYLRPFETSMQLPETGKGIESEYPGEWPEASGDAEAAAHAVLRAFWHLDRYELAAARARVQSALDRAPSFTLALNLFADISMRLANERPASGTRYQSDGEEAYQAALEADPTNKPAIVGLQSYYLERDQLDRAYELVQDISEGYQGRLDYVRGVIYARKGFDADARKRFEAALAGFVPAFDVYQRVFDDAFANRAEDKAEAVISRALDENPSYLPFIQRAVRLKGSDAAQTAIDTLKRLQALHPLDIQYGLELSDAYERQGDLDQAVSVLEDLAESFPEHPQPHDRMAALAMKQNQPAQALASYRSVNQIEPSWMQPFRAMRDAGGERFPYHEYDVQLEDIDLAMAEQWNDTRASGIYLLDIMVLEYHRDGTYDMYVHQAIQVLNQEGMQKWAETVIPQGGNVEVIMARTLAPNGLEWAVSNVQSLSGQQSLSMYGVEPGAIVEYAYLQRGGRSEPGVRAHTGGYYFGSDDDPMLLSKLVILVPDNLPFHLDRNPEDWAPQLSEKDGKLVYQWENWKQDGLKGEPFAPHLYQRVPSTQWSTGRDWLTLAERQRVSVYGYEEQSPDVEALADKLAEGAETPEALIEAVYGWIQTNIEDSSGGLTTADTLAQMAGGRYQKMRLMRQLLELNGIETQLALALDNKRSDGVRPLPFPNYAGSTLLRVPRQKGIEKPIHIDFSSRFAPLGQLDPQVKKQAALIYDGAVPYFEPLYTDLWEHGWLERRVSMSFNDDRSAELSGVYEYGNLYDRQIREMLTNPEVRSRLADAQAAQDFRGIRLASADMVNPDNLATPPRLEFRGSLPDAANEDVDGSIKIETNPIPSNIGALAGESERQFPAVFDASPLQDSLTVNFDLSRYLASGARILVPENRILISEFGLYSLFFAWEGETLTMKRSCLIPPQTIEPEEYGDFVDFCRSIEQYEDSVIQVISAL